MAIDEDDIRPLLPPPREDALKNAPPREPPVGVLFGWFYSTFSARLLLFYIFVSFIPALSKTLATAVGVRIAASITAGLALAPFSCGDHEKTKRNLFSTILPLACAIASSATRPLTQAGYVLPVAVFMSQGVSTSGHIPNMVAGTLAYLFHVLVAWIIERSQWAPGAIAVVLPSLAAIHACACLWLLRKRSRSDVASWLCVSCTALYSGSLLRSGLGASLCALVASIVILLWSCTRTFTPRNMAAVVGGLLAMPPAPLGSTTRTVIVGVLLLVFLTRPPERVAARSPDAHGIATHVVVACLLNTYLGDVFSLT